MEIFDTTYHVRIGNGPRQHILLTKDFAKRLNLRQVTMAIDNPGKEITIMRRDTTMDNKRYQLTSTITFNGTTPSLHERDNIIPYDPVLEERMSSAFITASFLFLFGFYTIRKKRSQSPEQTPLNTLVIIRISQCLAVIVMIIGIAYGILARQCQPITSEEVINLSRTILCLIVIGGFMMIYTLIWGYLKSSIFVIETLLLLYLCLMAGTIVTLLSISSGWRLIQVFVTMMLFGACVGVIWTRRFKPSSGIGTLEQQ